MLQYSSSLRKAVANQSGAMEADTISLVLHEVQAKNGRSSKSHKSRENFLNMKKVFLILIILICGVFSASAQSTVYFIQGQKSVGVPVIIKINNQFAFELRGDEKVFTGIKSYTPCQKKCTINTEGKVIFSFDYQGPSAPDVPRPVAGEIQVNLYEGSVHYILYKQIATSPVSVSYILQELSDAQGKKLIKDTKKYIVTKEYVYP